MTKIQVLLALAASIGCGAGPAPAAPGSPSAPTSPQHMDCRCPLGGGECSCTDATPHTEQERTEQLARVRALTDFWSARVAEDATMRVECHCHVGGGDCACRPEDKDLAAAIAAAADHAVAMTSWMHDHCHHHCYGGGGPGYGGPGYGGPGYGGPGYGGPGYGGGCEEWQYRGCGCGWVGCHCGSYGGSGCGWR